MKCGPRGKMKHFPQNQTALCGRNEQSEGPTEPSRLSVPGAVGRDCITIRWKTSNLRQRARREVRGEKNLARALLNYLPKGWLRVPILQSEMTSRTFTPPTCGTGVGWFASLSQAPCQHLFLNPFFIPSQVENQQICMSGPRVEEQALPQHLGRLPADLVGVLAGRDRLEG